MRGGVVIVRRWRPGEDDFVHAIDAAPGVKHQLAGQCTQTIERGFKPGEPPPGAFQRSSSLPGNVQIPGVVVPFPSLRCLGVLR